MEVRKFVVVLALVFFSMATVASADDAKDRYERNLRQVYDMTYGARLTTSAVDAAVQKFAEGMARNPEVAACPELGKATDAFAKKEFRIAVTKYFSSDELRDEVLAAMRKSYTAADLEAYLAFAATPAGASFLAHQQKSEAEAELAVAAKVEHLEDSPIMKQMFSDMMGMLIGPMMQCKRKNGG